VRLALWSKCITDSAANFLTMNLLIKCISLLTVYIPSKYARFVQCSTSPVGLKKKKYTGWQEACRKDIERAFALLQGNWQCKARPMYQIELKNVGEIMAACLILHNMCVSDHVMDDVRDVYDPASSMVFDESTIEYMPDMMERQGHTSANDRSETGTSFASQKSIRVHYAKIGLYFQRIKENYN
jgi:Plant transposon protein